MDHDAPHAPDSRHRAASRLLFLAALAAGCAMEPDAVAGRRAETLLDGTETAPAVARPTLDGELRVTESGDLVLRSVQGDQLVDERVEPTFALSADGRWVAWSRSRSPIELELVVAPTDDLSAIDVVSGALSTADRPIFAGPRELVFVGARADGVAGIWRVDLDSREPAPLTNAHLAAGTGDWEGFVPPPADPTSMRIEAAELVYDDGEAERRIALAVGGAQ